MQSESTIAIVTMDRPTILKETLENLRDNDILENVLIIDGSDSNDTKRLCEELEVKHQFQESGGMTSARNEALEECDTKYITYIDDDVRVSKDWYKKIIDEFDTHEDIVGVTGLVSTPSSNQGYWLENRIREFLSGGRSREGEISDDGSISGRFDYAERKFVDHMPGCNMSYDTETLKRAGGFDELFDRGNSYREETAASYRLQDFGKIVYNPKIKVKHLRAEENRDPEIYLYCNAYNTRLFLNKYGVINGWNNHFKHVYKNIVKNLAYLAKYKSGYMSYLRGEVDSLVDVHIR